MKVKWISVTENPLKFWVIKSKNSNPQGRENIVIFGPIQCEVMGARSHSTHALQSLNVFLFSGSQASIGFSLVQYSMKIKWANSLNSLKLQNATSLQILQNSAEGFKSICTSNSWLYKVSLALTRIISSWFNCNGLHNMNTCWESANLCHTEINRNHWLPGIMGKTY